MIDWIKSLFKPQEVKPCCINIGNTYKLVTVEEMLQIMVNQEGHCLNISCTGCPFIRHQWCMGVSGKREDKAKRVKLAEKMLIDITVEKHLLGN